MTTQREHLLKDFIHPVSGDVMDLRPYIAFTGEDPAEVHYVLTVFPEIAAHAGTIKEKLDTLFKSLKGVRAVKGVLTAHRAGEKPKTSPRTPFKEAVAGIEVRHFVAVASGKGGVGKSTTALNLAVALARQGVRVGLLDADIYGPSLPTLLGEKQKPDVNEARKIIPFKKYGIEAMSIGFLVSQETAMIWRGPMVQGALFQLLKDVAWGPLDVMIIDMPPGTGDAHLSLAQGVSLSGALLVSTPQDIAWADARRAAAMFQKLDVPILGVIQNMSTFVCPHCTQESHVFGREGAREGAAQLGLPFLGDIPLDLRIRDGNDKATPVASQSGHAISEMYAKFAAEIWEKVNKA